MDYWWHQFCELIWHYGTPELVLVGAAVGVVGGLLTGVVLLGIEIIRALPAAFAEGRAKERERRLAKKVIGCDTRAPAAPPNDLPPTSDI